MSDAMYYIARKRCAELSSKDEKTSARLPSADALRRNPRLQRPTGPAIAAKHRSLRPHVRARPMVPSVGRDAAGRLEPIRAVRSRTGGSMRIDRGAGEGARTSVPAARSRNRLFGPRAGRGTACPHNASRHLRQASRGMAAQGRGYGNGRFSRRTDIQRHLHQQADEPAA